MRNHSFASISFECSHKTVLLLAAKRNHTISTHTVIWCQWWNNAVRIFFFVLFLRLLAGLIGRAHAESIRTSPTVGRIVRVCVYAIVVMDFMNRRRKSNECVVVADYTSICVADVANARTHAHIHLYTVSDTTKWHLGARERESVSTVAAARCVFLFTSFIFFFSCRRNQTQRIKFECLQRCTVFTIFQ